MRNNLFLAAILSTTMFLTSCEIAGGIFKAGMWIGIIMVIVVVAIVWWILSKLRK